MAAAIEQVIQGPAFIFTAPAGTAMPERADIADLVAGTLVGWTSRGYTTGAVTLVENISQTPILAEQAARALGHYNGAAETRVETTLRQATLENLASTLHGTADDVADTITARKPHLAEAMAIAFVGPGFNGSEVGEGAETLFAAPLAVISTSASLAFTKEAALELAATFTILDAGPTTDDYVLYAPTGA